MNEKQQLRQEVIEEVIEEYNIDRTSYDSLSLMAHARCDYTECEFEDFPEACSRHNKAIKDLIYIFNKTLPSNK